jgi:hypothetical protein
VFVTNVNVDFTFVSFCIVCSETDNVLHISLFVCFFFFVFYCAFVDFDSSTHKTIAFLSSVTLADSAFRRFFTTFVM